MEHNSRAIDYTSATGISTGVFYTMQNSGCTTQRSDWIYCENYCSGYVCGWWRCWRPTWSSRWICFRHRPWNSRGICCRPIRYE
jgi:hypothetical protein